MIIRMQPGLGRPSAAMVANVLALLGLVTLCQAEAEHNGHGGGVGHLDTLGYRADIDNHMPQELSGAGTSPASVPNSQLERPTRATRPCGINDTDTWGPGPRRSM